MLHVFMPLEIVFPSIDLLAKRAGEGDSGMCLLMAFEIMFASKSGGTGEGS